MPRYVLYVSQGGRGGYDMVLTHTSYLSVVAVHRFVSKIATQKMICDQSDKLQI